MKTDHMIIANLHISIPQMKKSGLSIDDPLGACVNAAAAVRTNFYDHSIPWKENGDRLMTIWVFDNFYTKHKELCTALATKQVAFADAYLAAVDQMEFHLVEDFKPEDFPSEHEIMKRSSIIFNMDKLSMPLAPGDPEEAGAAMIENFPERTEHRFAEADRALREKLRKPLENFIAGFSKPKGFFESQLAAVTRMGSIVRQLNYAGDNDLINICDIIASDIGSISMKDLRAEESMRKAAVAGARRILTNLRAET